LARAELGRKRKPVWGEGNVAASLKGVPALGIQNRKGLYLCKKYQTKRGERERRGEGIFYEFRKQKTKERA